MHDERTPMTMPAEMLLEQGKDGRRRVAVRQRHAQDAGRLVDDEQEVVFEEDLQLTELEWSGATLRAPWPVHPDTNDITLAQTPRRVGEPHLGVIQEYLAALERRRDSPARPESIGCGKELVEPDLAIVRPDLPL